MENIQRPKQKKRPVKDLRAVQETLRVFLGDRPEISLAYLFGSYVDRNTGLFHDIDVAILICPQEMEKLDQALPYGYRADLSIALAQRIGFYPVDLVLLNFASPLLLRRVIGTGKLIFCRTETDRVNFEVESLKRYADTAHIRRIKHSYTKKRIEKGLGAYA
jgi:predicted nucleotidyltransferase